MDIELHKTIMMDGSTVTDVDIMTNTRRQYGVIPRCIVTFDTEDRALDFANRLLDLLDEFDVPAKIEVL